jgi:hypothetical protein
VLNQGVGETDEVLAASKLAKYARQGSQLAQYIQQRQIDNVIKNSPYSKDYSTSRAPSGGVRLSRNAHRQPETLNLESIQANYPPGGPLWKQQLILATPQRRKMLVPTLEKKKGSGRSNYQEQILIS